MARFWLEKGSAWKLVKPDGEIADSGMIEEIEEKKRIVLKWQNQFRPDLKAEGYSRCTIELEPEGETVRLSITHEIDVDESKFIGAVSNGWPKIMASLKSLLETGTALPELTKWPK